MSSPSTEIAQLEGDGTPTHTPAHSMEETGSTVVHNPHGDIETDERRIRRPTQRGREYSIAEKERKLSGVHKTIKKAIVEIRDLMRQDIDGASDKVKILNKSLDEFISVYSEYRKLLEGDDAKLDEVTEISNTVFRDVAEGISHF